MGGSDAEAAAPQIPAGILEQPGKFKKAKGPLGVQVSERCNESSFTTKCSESSFLGKCSESSFIEKGSESSLKFNQHHACNEAATADSNNSGYRLGADSVRMPCRCNADAEQMHCGCSAECGGRASGVNLSEGGA